MEPGDPLVEELGQHVHAERVLLGAAVELDLGEHLVGEAHRHHEARVAGGVAEVQEATLGQDDDRVPVGEHELVHLRLDLDLADVALTGQAGHVDLVVEVTDVPDDGVVLHLRHVLGGDDPLVAGAGDEQVGGVERGSRGC